MNTTSRTGTSIAFTKGFRFLFVFLRTQQRTNAFHRTSVFDEWLALLKDKTGKAMILKRIRSAEAGNFSDCKPVSQGVSEMRVHFGPGYRA